MEQEHLIEGGFQSLPQMFMPGALLVGCDAGDIKHAKNQRLTYSNEKWNDCSRNHK